MRPARLAPAMISTLDHRVPRRRQRGAPPGPGAIRPGSTLIEEVRFATVSPPEGDDPNPRPRWCLVPLLGSRREDRVPTRPGKTMAATLHRAAGNMAQKGPGIFLCPAQPRTQPLPH